MSTFPNANYAPPPPMGQMNVLNGQIPPTQQQPLPAQQFALQQQQILQHKQQLFNASPTAQTQGTTTPSNPSINASNMSKFMPPSATFSNSTLNQPPHTTPNSSAAGLVNGPTATRPAANNNALNSNINNLRSAPTVGSNGPSSLISAQASLINGSANSSRTASPSLQQMPPPNAALAPSRPANNQMPLNLSGSMQNLNLNRQNGSAASMPVTSGSVTSPLGALKVVPPILRQQQQPFMGNVQANFKTSALNTSAPIPPPGHSLGASPSMLQSPNANRTGHVSQAPQMQTSNANIYGVSTAPPMMQPPPNFQQSMQQPPVGMPPPTTGPAMQQQNQLNNNQQQQPPVAAPPATVRKPMYPTAPSNQMPPMPITQPQQIGQQHYSSVYQQQQQLPPQMPPMPGAAQPAPGMFNGQSSNAPLQYQSAATPQQLQQQQQQQPMGAFPSGPTQYNPQLSVTQQGFSRLWGQDTIDLMQNRQILTPATLPPPKIVLHNQFHESINCNPNIMRCTIAKIPESNSLLQKSRLPLGILIHPFRDINSLPVIQCPNIVRCRLCRTYINPFVYFVDSKMWKCNLCYRANELPDDFQFDPATKTYGDVTRRPEVRSSTIEFIAPSEYMLRPPQPAIYLFLFDVSIIAQQSGYLENVCAVLSKHLEDMPGDARTQVGFIAYNSEVHFYSMAEGYNQPHEMTLIDIDDAFLPRPDNLLVNLKECKELVRDLLAQMPQRFADTHDPGSALGAALQVAYKLMQASGGRITVFQTCLPKKGPGSLEPREDPNNRSAKDVAHLTPATDFYKRYALECSGYQIAVDLFLLNQQYSDLATISGISKHSGGCIHHFPLYQKTKPQHVESFKNCFKRYLVRKIGFEAVMRIRCTRGLQVHTFHGNFFVRSTDLLSLPNVNPDAGYGMQISYEESLSDVKTICFQAALLYTNSEGERRIRVHTMCLPVSASLSEIMHAADTEAIIGLLSKMAVDRSITSNVADAREAFMNATIDILSAFKVAQNLPSGQTGQLIAPRSLALMPMYILAMLKHPAFRVGTSTRLDDRVYAMECMKNLPLDQLMRYIYPEFYCIDALFYNSQNSNNTEEDEEEEVIDLPRLQLSAEYLDSRCMFLMDCGLQILIYVGLNVPSNILENVFGIKSTAELPDYCYGLPNVNSPENDLLKRFILRLNDEKPFSPIVQIIRDTSTAKPQFIEKLVDDRSESSLSYYEFLQHIRTQVK